MSFEQAKSDFEAKTKAAPESVEGGEQNFARFRDNTKNYLIQKKNEVISFHTTYPGSEEDKAKYLKAMNSALDRVLDKASGKEKYDVTKSEIGIYKAELLKNSVAFKNKLERKTVEKKFQETISVLLQNGLMINVNQFIDDYLSLPKDKRLPVNQIESEIKGLMNSADTPRLKTELFINSKLTFKALNNLVKGNLHNAREVIKNINQKLDLVRSLKAIKNHTDLKNLSDDTLYNVLNSLILSGIKYENVINYFVKGIEKLRKFDKENFDNCIKNMPSEELALFLKAAIIQSANDNSRNNIDGIKLTLMVEGELAKARNENMAGLQKSSKDLNAIKKSYDKYKKENPNVEMDKKTAEFEKDIAQKNWDAGVYNHNLILTQAKHTLCNLILSNRNTNPSSPKTQKLLKDIILSKNFDEFKKCASLSSFPRPPGLNALQAASLQIEVLDHEKTVKKWISDNEAIQVRYQVTSRRFETAKIFPLDVHKKFIETGTLSETQIAILGNKYHIHSETLTNTLIGHYQGEFEANNEFNKFSKNNTRTINQLSERERLEASSSSQGYLDLLGAMHGSCIQIISQLESLLILQQKAKNPDNPIKEFTGLKQKIRDYKEKAAELRKKAENVAKFLNKKIEGNTDDIDSLAASPLYGPLLKNRIQPFVNRMKVKEAAIQNAYAPLTNIDPYIKEQIRKDAHPSLISHGFERGIRLISSFAEAMKDARQEAISVKNDLEMMIKDPQLPKNMPASVKKMYIQMLKNKIAQIDENLTNSKSPISVKSILRARNAAAYIAAKQREYNMKKFKRGIAIAVCIAAAGFAAWGAGLGMAAAGGKLFGTVAAGGAFTPGAITVSAGASKLLVGGMMLTGSSAGGVVGSRLIMTGFDLTGFSDFGGMRKIWNPKKMGKEFIISFGLSVLMVGAAHGVLRGASFTSKSTYFNNRFPGFANFSRNIVAKNNLNKILAGQTPVLGARPPQITESMRKTSEQHHRLRLFWHNKFNHAVDRQILKNPILTRTQAEKAVLKDTKNLLLKERVKTLNLRNFNPKTLDLRTPSPHIPRPASRPAQTAVTRREITPRPAAEQGTVVSKSTVPKTQPLLKTTTAAERERLYWYNKLQRDTTRYINEKRIKDTPRNRFRAEEVVMKNDAILKTKVNTLNIRGWKPDIPNIRTATPRVPQAVPAAARPARITSPQESTLVTQKSGVQQPRVTSPQEPTVVKPKEGFAAPKPAAAESGAQTVVGKKVPVSESAPQQAPRPAAAETSIGKAPKFALAKSKTKELGKQTTGKAVHEAVSPTDASSINPDVKPAPAASVNRRAGTQVSKRKKAI
ncbi:hypothetical protein JW911_01355 [Candidatus Peregrinibacteria bacterium]|nr:hypothetical protein [Candidatus Peregrinibacteria bacterium]